MIQKLTNPFPNDPDRSEIWTMLVERDIDAFLASDFGVVEDDFYSEIFIGIDGQGSNSIDSWSLNFPNLDSYKKEWLRQAADFHKNEFSEDPRIALFKATTMRDIEINGNSCLIRKKFDGKIERKNDSPLVLNWQTLYKCLKVNNRWKIIGFVGYLPYQVIQKGSEHLPAYGKRLPVTANQHKTAGPYSPVLEVSGREFVVISGQAPIDMEGNVIGETIEEQTRFMLKNCKTQLAEADVDFKDVFKCNVYLTNLNLWDRFNVVYREIMPEPFPARTAVQTPLLYNFLVEIEMWAVK